jgi:hypothetical protein
MPAAQLESKEVPVTLAAAPDETREWQFAIPRLFASSCGVNRVTSRSLQLQEWQRAEANPGGYLAAWDIPSAFLCVDAARTDLLGRSFT